MLNLVIAVKLPASATRLHCTRSRDPNCTRDTGKLKSRDFYFWHFNVSRCHKDSSHMGCAIVLKMKMETFKPMEGFAKYSKN